MAAVGTHTTPKQPIMDVAYTTCCARVAVLKHRLSTAAPAILNPVPRAAITSSDMYALKELVRGRERRRMVCAACGCRPGLVGASILEHASHRVVALKLSRNRVA